MPALGKKALIQVNPGVSPTTDLTNLDSVFYVNGDKIRFQHGKLRKLQGWIRQFSTNNIRINGAARLLYNYTATDGISRTLIGTSGGLYCYQNGNLFNITPLQISSTPIANSISTIYYTDSAYSLTTVADSNLVTFNIPHYLTLMDRVAISGVTGTIGGISNTYFNNTFTVVAIPNSQSFQVLIATNAISSATGGGSTINFATTQLVVSLNNHGLNPGDRMSIEGSAAVGSIGDTSINIENNVEYVISPNQFIINTDTMATSYVTGGGGAGAILYIQIPAGESNQSYGFGYGGGLYGTGLYGVGKDFSFGFRYPRIWSCDRFGDNVVLTPGDQNKVYIWNNDLSVAPTVLTNAPTSVNWVFQSHGMVCVLGPDGNPNVMRSTNTGDATDWALSVSSTATIITVPGCSRFISQASARNVDLLFSISKVYQMRYDGLPFVWSITELLSTDGIIGPKARANIEDAVFWMGNGDFFVFDGTSVNLLANNTIKRYVFDNINDAQSYKSFASTSPGFNEVWWFYPAGSDNEPNNYVIYNYKEQHWSIGTLERTAAVEPANAITSVYMVQSNIVTTEQLTTDPLSTNFYVLGTNPLSTTDTTPTVVINTGAHKILPGDSINVSGATGTGGIIAGNINGARIVASVSTNTISITAGANATSTTSGGGSGITIGTRVVTVLSSHVFSNGIAVTLEGISNFGGFTSADLTGTFTIRTYTSSSFEVAALSDYSTAQVSGGGEFVQLTYPRTGRLFEHEVGFNDYDGDNCDATNPDSCIKPLYSFAETNYAQLGDGDMNTLIYSVIPDSTQVGSMSITVKTKQYPQSSVETIKGPFTITENIDKVDVMALGRQRKYLIQSNELNQDFRLGKWYEQIKETTPI